MTGLDRSVLENLNFKLAISRIQTDISTDFIIAPHYNAVFVKASDELISRTIEKLKAGNYETSLPHTMSIPKKGGFSRPGSILEPSDRLIYQALADRMSALIEIQLDRSRSFSHILSDDTTDSHMFKPARTSWESFQEKLASFCQSGSYILKSDVANYFERIPQHHLINLIHASGCEPEVVSFLEKMLLAFREKNSFGIVQGCFPSDLLGNFYLSDLDAFFELNDLPSARFVDDCYVKFKSKAKAMRGLLALIDRLRKNGLHLNEYKSGIIPAEELIREATEIDIIFKEARDQIINELIEKQAESQVSTNRYGFSIEWELEEPNIDPEDEDIRLEAVIRLYESLDDYPKQSDKIEKFCLPILALIGSDIAVERSIRGLIDKPYMAQVYNSYLMKFASRSNDIAVKLENVIDSSDIVSDFQIMYLLAALLNCKAPSRQSINKAIRILENFQVSKEVRAMAALFAAKFGNPQQKRCVKLSYESEPSSYVRASILYASKYFTTPEKRTCIRAWSGHNFINSLIASVLLNL